LKTHGSRELSFCVTSVATLLVIVTLALTACATPAERNWERTRKSNSIDGYKRYVMSYPQSPHVAEAHERIRVMEEWEQERKEKRLFREAQSTESTRRLLEYIKQYPQGKYADEAKVLLEQSQFKEAMKSEPPDNLKTFLEKYPNSRFAAEAKQNLELRGHLIVKPVAILKKDSYVQNFGFGERRVNTTHLQIRLTNTSKQTIVNPKYHCAGSRYSRSDRVINMSMSSGDGTYKASVAPGATATTTFISHGDFELTNISCFYKP